MGGGLSRDLIWSARSWLKWDCKARLRGQALGQGAGNRVYPPRTLVGCTLAPGTLIWGKEAVLVAPQLKAEITNIGALGKVWTDWLRVGLGSRSRRCGISGICRVRLEGLTTGVGARQAIGGE